MHKIEAPRRLVRVYVLQLVGSCEAFLAGGVLRRLGRGRVRVALENFKEERTRKKDDLQHRRRWKDLR